MVSLLFSPPVPPRLPMHMCTDVSQSLRTSCGTGSALATVFLSTPPSTSSRTSAIPHLILTLQHCSNRHHAIYVTHNDCRKPVSQRQLVFLPQHLPPRPQFYPQSSSYSVNPVVHKGLPVSSEQPPLHHHCLSAASATVKTQRTHIQVFVFVIGSSALHSAPMTYQGQGDTRWLSCVANDH